MNAQDCPPFLGLPDYVQLIGGATLTAVSALHNDVSNTAICWDGGRLFIRLLLFSPHFKMLKSDTMRKNRSRPASVTLQIVFWRS
jgi:hypothetical protein